MRRCTRSVPGLRRAMECICMARRARTQIARTAGTNYWVDVVYDQSSGNAPPTVTSVNPGPGASGVGLGSTMSVSFSQPMDPTSITSANFTVIDPSNNPIPGTLSLRPGLVLDIFSSRTQSLPL